MTFKTQEIFGFRLLQGLTPIVHALGDLNGN